MAGGWAVQTPPGFPRPARSGGGPNDPNDHSTLEERFPEKAIVLTLICWRLYQRGSPTLFPYHRTYSIGASVYVSRTADRLARCHSIRVSPGGDVAWGGSRSNSIRSPQNDRLLSIGSAAAAAVWGTVTSTCGTGGSLPSRRRLFDAREPSRGPLGGRWRRLSLRSSRSTGRSAARCRTTRRRRHRAR